MAIISISNLSYIKVKFDHGTDLNGKRVIKTRTYSNVKSDASGQDIVTIVTSLAGLQQHTLGGINKIDNTSLSE